MSRSLTACALGLALTLGGCSLIPDYQRPPLPVAERFDGAGDAAAPLPGWRGFIQDPALRELVERALESNRDLRQAALNLEAYRALYRIERAALYPQLDAGVDASRTRTPADLARSERAQTSSQYSATLGVAWELDLFGRLASQRERALELYLASAAGQRSAQLSLVAAVASTWMAWQADQALLALSQDTLEAYRNSLKLTQRSFDLGVASALELSQARSAVASAEAAQARYRRQVAQDRNALALLLGQPLPAHLSPAAAFEHNRWLADFPVGLPSELLLQRPDVLEAEHQLRAANANIGAARAAFFPRLQLTGAAGSASAELSGLFDGGSQYWSFRPGISVPIFSAGQLRASLDYATLSRDAGVARYERAIQAAFREVNDGLAARATYGEQIEAQRALVKASEDYYRLAERRYRTGVDSYLVLLDAQRQLFSARQQLIVDLLARQLAEVELYKALGGGWQADAPPAS